MNRHIAFSVERLTCERERALVDGRVCESPIRVGDVFTKIYSHGQRWDGKKLVAADAGPARPVRLVIQSIESYRRCWDELSSGMTARLIIAGMDLIGCRKVKSLEMTMPPNEITRDRPRAGRVHC